MIICHILSTTTKMFIIQNFKNQLIKERELSKRIDEAKYFYAFCNGDDWEQVVDNDTNALCQFAESNIELFKKPLRKLECEILLTGSRMDDMLGNDFKEKYLKIISKVKNGKIHLFDNGFHPAVISNAVTFSEIVSNFLN